MSASASVLRWVLRRNQSSEADLDIEETREGMERLARKLPRPRGVIFQRASLGGVPAVRAAHWQSDADRAALLLHGGGFIGGSASGHAAIAGRYSKASRGVVYTLDYRLAPEHPHPAAVTDAVAAVRALAERVPGGRLAIIGESAGGAIALSALHELRDSGGPLPRCGVLTSPWLDLTLSADSMTERADGDVGLSAARLAPMAEHYAAGRLDQPGPSPLFGDQSGLPPLLLQTGGDEILRGDAERLAARAREQGVEVTLEVWDGMWHAWHGFAPFLSEARRAIAAVGAFLRSRT